MLAAKTGELTMTRSSLVVLGMVVLVLLDGCATPARVEQMTTPASAARAATIPDALKQNIAIKDVTGGKETNPLWTSQVSSSEFEAALEASLRNAGVLQPNRQAGRYGLIANLDKLEQPLIGIDMTVTATVTYTLVERSTSKTVWQKTLATPYTAKFGDALFAVERLKVANEGAARANISALIGELESLRL
jgi:hypothetical protein